jgi:seryl-tRNA synthetase
MTIETTPAEKEFLDELVHHRLLIPSGVPGVFGRSAVFEDVLESFDRLVSAAGRKEGAEVLRFPPVMNRHDFERSDFMKSFPQMTGTVFSFTGTHAQHMSLVEHIHAGKDWSSFETMTDVVLVPAACYPIYPMCTGTLPPEGRLFDVASYCFRHEPSGDPARMQAFRQHELVRIGDADTVVAWRDTWVDRGKAMLRSVGLPVESDVAADIFFGRGGKLLAANQKDQRLKFEVLMPICSTENPTAVMSVNYHQDFFGQIFELRTSDGAVAHTSCLGFGMERVVLGLFKTHGPRPEGWPTAVRAVLWP